MITNERGFRFFGIPFNGCLFLIAFGAILVLLLFTLVTKAQDTVYTHFEQTCIETLSPLHYRIQFGYTSTGVETFQVETTANVSIGNTVTTDTGYHFLGYLDAQYTDSPYDFTVTFTGANDTSVLHLNTWTVNKPCGVSTVAVDATPEPAPSTVTDDCPAWSINGGTGERFCLWSLPYASKSQ